jgi:hypothetical protein
VVRHWNRFSGLPIHQKPLKRLQAVCASSTPLKRGVNEMRLAATPATFIPCEKDFPRATGRVCSPHALCGGRPEMNNQTSLIQPEQIEQVILLIRGQRVMLDRDLKRK